MKVTKHGVSKPGATITLSGLEADQLYTVLFQAHNRSVVTTLPNVWRFNINLRDALGDSGYEHIKSED